MFGFYKKKGHFILTAPVNGKLIELSHVNDPVFAKKMMGDGIAFYPDKSHIIDVASPVSGKIISLASTKHAFGVETKDGKQVLVHIGIDTVNLKGRGFVKYKNEGDNVKHGEKIISIDSAVIQKNNLDPTVMVIFIQGYNKKIIPKVKYNSQVRINQEILA